MDFLAQAAPDPPKTFEVLFSNAIGTQSGARGCLPVSPDLGLNRAKRLSQSSYGRNLDFRTERAKNLEYRPGRDEKN